MTIFVIQHLYEVYIFSFFYFHVMVAVTTHRSLNSHATPFNKLVKKIERLCSVEGRKQFFFMY